VALAVLYVVILVEACMVEAPLVCNHQELLPRVQAIKQKFDLRRVGPLAKGFLDDELQLGVANVKALLDQPGDYVPLSGLPGPLSDSFELASGKQVHDLKVAVVDRVVKRQLALDVRVPCQLNQVRHKLS
jgi:hypothetical protein